MKTLPETNPLLADLLATPETEAFREEMFRQALDCAQTRRHTQARNRVLKQVVGPLAILAVAFAAFYHPAPSKAALFQWVATQPLREGQQVHTGLFAVRQVQTSSGGFALVTTDPRRSSVKALSDQELLAMFPGRPRALVADAEGHHRLLFLDETQPTE